MDKIQNSMLIPANYLLEGSSCCWACSALMVMANLWRCGQSYQIKASRLRGPPTSTERHLWGLVVVISLSSTSLSKSAGSEKWASSLWDMVLLGLRGLFYLSISLSSTDGRGRGRPNDGVSTFSRQQISVLGVDHIELMCCSYRPYR